MTWTSLITWFLVISSAYGQIPDTGNLQHCNRTQSLSQTALRNILQRVPDADKVREWSRYYTNGSHVAGQGLKQAQWTQALWDKFGVPQTRLKSYVTNLTLPNEHRVALLDTERSGNQVIHEAPLIEDNAATAGDGQVPFIRAFFAWAGKGNVTAQYIFANYGTRKDYEDLAQANISVTGKIAVVKSTFGSEILKENKLVYHRSNQATVARELGLAGMLIYTDPQMDGGITTENGYQAFPDGPARPPSLIERGGLGTYTPPGQIPAVPISYNDAIPILSALNGHGPLAGDFNDRWQGGGLVSLGVAYNVGPSPENVVLNVYNNPDVWVGPVHDVIGTISGCVFPNEVVILGNHRDAWGPGAADGNSGSAALNEVARSLATALKEGWQPLRTIILASWEGEEIGQPGSSRWIAENQPWLNTSVAAYLNVVVAGGGTNFHAQGSPLLGKAMRNAAGQVEVPAKQNASAQTVLDVWGGKLGLGSGGDAIQFQASTFSFVDFGFTGGPKDPVFPYHSLFDTDTWMEQYGDPGRGYHLTTTKVWSHLGTALADELILPYRIQDYAPVFRDGLNSVSSTAGLSSHLDLTSLDRVIDDFAQASAAFDTYSDSLADQAKQQPSNSTLLSRVQEVNHKYINFERFLGDPDLPSNDTSHHLVILPSPYYFETSPFPGLSSAIAAEDWTRAAGFRDKIVNQISRAVAFLH